MKRYRDFQPTGFDSRANYSGGTERDHWYVAPVSINRDTECAIALSNWESVVKDLQADKTSGCEIHRFGHWACGWYELILVHPWRKDLLAKLEDTERALENCPVLDDTLHSEKEQELISEHWENWANRELEKWIESYFELDDSPTEAQFNALKELIQQRAHYDILDSNGTLHTNHIKYVVEHNLTQEQINSAFEAVD